MAKEVPANIYDELVKVHRPPTVRCAITRRHRAKGRGARALVGRRLGRFNPSTRTYIKDSPSLAKGKYEGRNVHFRDSRARHGRLRQRHGRFRWLHPLRLDVPHLQRLHAALDQARRAVACMRCSSSRTTASTSAKTGRPTSRSSTFGRCGSSRTSISSGRPMGSSAQPRGRTLSHAKMDRRPSRSRARSPRSSSETPTSTHGWSSARRVRTQKGRAPEPDAAGHGERGPGHGGDGGVARACRLPLPGRLTPMPRALSGTASCLPRASAPPRGEARLARSRAHRSLAILVWVRTGSPWASTASARRRPTTSSPRSTASRRASVSSRIRERFGDRATD